MKKVDIFDAEIERLIKARQKALEAELERSTRYGMEPAPDGSVVAWGMRFQKKGMKYLYAAIKANGLWYTTGPNSPKGYTWDELTAWLDEAHKVKGFEELT